MLTADLHLHTDFDHIQGAWHGMRPEILAAEIINRGIDVYAVTNHTSIPGNPFEDFRRVQETIEIVRQEAGREIIGIFGTESTVDFQGRHYHIGYLYEDDPSEQNPPYLLHYGADYKYLEQYRQGYPGMAIVNHPTWKDHLGGGNDPAATLELMQSGLIDGAELLNGSMLGNGANISMTTSAIEMYLRTIRGGRKLAATASSDAHKPHLVGSVVTLINGSTKANVFEEIREGRTRISAREPNIVIPKVRMATTGIEGIRSILEI